MCFFVVAQGLKKKKGGGRKEKKKHKHNKDVTRTHRRNKNKRCETTFSLLSKDLFCFINV